MEQVRITWPAPPQVVFEIDAIVPRSYADRLVEEDLIRVCNADGCRLNGQNMTGYHPHPQDSRRREVRQRLAPFMEGGEDDE